MAAIGTVWSAGTWNDNAWADFTWADAAAAEGIGIGDIFTATANIKQLTLSSSLIVQHNLSTQFIKQILAETVER